MRQDLRTGVERERLLRAARRVVIKVGTATVTGAEGKLCLERMEPIARSISALMKAGRQVVLVSSGAVGLGGAGSGFTNRAWMMWLQSRRVRRLARVF